MLTLGPDDSYRCLTVIPSLCCSMRVFRTGAPLIYLNKSEQVKSYSKLWYARKLIAPLPVFANPIPTSWKFCLLEIAQGGLWHSSGTNMAT